ncbi:MAG: NAD(P)-binding protein [Candidatus Micrarchaeaceae archaeon]|jgi:voltage-gated potassium channel Kch
MANQKRAQYTLITIVLLLFIASFLMSVVAGISPQKALIDNSLDSLQVGYNIVQFTAAENPLFLVSRLLNAAIFPILTVILAVWFFDFISSINLREGLVISRIKKLKNYVIVVPYNSFAKSLLQELKNSGMNAVIIAENKNELLHLYKESHLAVMGDLRSVETFELAGIDRARCVVACSKDDVQNALVTITAKTARPNIEVFARANKEENVERLDKSGAYRTILVESTAGKEIGEEIAKRVLSKAGLKNA